MDSAVWKRYFHPEQKLLSTVHIDVYFIFQFRAFGCGILFRICVRDRHGAELVKIYFFLHTETWFYWQTRKNKIFDRLGWIQCFFSGPCHYVNVDRKNLNSELAFLILLNNFFFLISLRMKFMAMICNEVTKIEGRFTGSEDSTRLTSRFWRFIIEIHLLKILFLKSLFEDESFHLIGIKLEIARLNKSLTFCLSRECWRRGLIGLYFQQRWNLILYSSSILFR